ncbi:MAG: ABC transporter permease subunit [Candidatus Hydrogenedentota bacterium]
MPIYRQSYREYEGEVRRHFRWWTVLEQEWRILVSAKPFRYLTLLALVHALLRLFQVIAYDTVRQDATSALSVAIRTVEDFAVNESLFYDFIRIQAPLAFLLMLYAGAGMICNDFRNNLNEVYFAKPITWRDYLFGKLGVLLCVGLLVTAVPAVVLVAAHNLLLADVAVLAETWWWAPASVAFSLVIVVPAALTILAVSAIVKSQRFAAVAVFMLVIAASAMGGIFAQMLRDPRFVILSPPMAMNRVGIALFGVRQWTYRLDWAPCLALLGVWCVLALVLLAWRIRRAEVDA